jgi:NADH-quinone oxidoreductase subunit E
MTCKVSRFFTTKTSVGKDIAPGLITVLCDRRHIQSPFIRIKVPADQSRDFLCRVVERARGTVEYVLSVRALGSPLLPSIAGDQASACAGEEDRMPEEMVQALNARERLLIDQAVAEHGDGAGALLGILEDVQAANPHKFLSLDTLRYVAAKTGIPPAKVYSFATFYALFNLDPQGDNVVCVCRGTACHTRGSRDLLAKLCLDLGLHQKNNDDSSDADKLSLTTKDHHFTVRTVACFGQCALAPVVEVNHHILSHVNERTLQREINQLSSRKR